MLNLLHRNRDHGIDVLLDPSTCLFLKNEPIADCQRYDYLLKAEAAERHLRSIRYRLGQARFPTLKDLDNFVFENTIIDENQIRSLYDGGFIQ